MSELAAFAYFSSASTEFTENELETLLQTAREENARTELTGVLLYHDGTFFQYIEGPKRELDAAYERIKKSRRHHGIIQLFHREITTREFSGWRMGFAKVPKSTILQLSHTEWSELAATNTPKSGRAVGMTLLQEFWKSSSR